MNDEVFGFANADVAEVQNNLEALANGLVKILHGSADGVHPVAGYTVARAPRARPTRRKEP